MSNHRVIPPGGENSGLSSLLAEAFCTTEGIDVVRPEPSRATIKMKRRVIFFAIVQSSLLRLCFHSVCKIATFSKKKKVLKRALRSLQKRGL